VLPAGESVTVTAGYVTTAANFEDGGVTNVAIVGGTGVDSGVRVGDEDDETVLIVEVQDVVIVQPEPKPAPEPEPAVRAAQPLPRTGADAHLLFNLGLLMAAMGAAALLFTPRRRRDER
jgi:LPXTG-motif cell wall-anchored protein